MPSLKDTEGNEEDPEAVLEEAVEDFSPPDSYMADMATFHKLTQMSRIALISIQMRRILWLKA